MMRVGYFVVLSCLVCAVGCKDKAQAPAAPVTTPPQVEAPPAAAPQIKPEDAVYAPKEAACAWELMSWGESLASCEAYTKHVLDSGEYEAVTCKESALEPLVIGERFELRYWTVCLYADCAIERGVLYSFDRQKKRHAISTFHTQAADGDDALSAKVTGWSAQDVLPSGGPEVVVRFEHAREGTQGSADTKRTIGALLSLIEAPVWVGAWEEARREKGQLVASSAVSFVDGKIVISAGEPAAASAAGRFGAQELGQECPAQLFD